MLKFERTAVWGAETRAYGAFAARNLGARISRWESGNSTVLNRPGPVNLPLHRHGSLTGVPDNVRVVLESQDVVEVR